MKRPNIMLVTVDQWPASLMGHAGHPTVLTPTLDQLARNGVCFPNTYSECPICIPARRTLMTGNTARIHGDRSFDPVARMPPQPTLAATLGAAGYQTRAVGKLHVYPPRDRIGFDDVHLAEEGRPHLGGYDDYDLFLADQGFPGQGFNHGMNNNDYLWRPFHLPEHCHVTNWTTWKMCREIKRRDPTRPGFWHLSYTAPHPPLAPLQAYLDIYRDAEPPVPPVADWAQDEAALPYALRSITDYWSHVKPHHLRGIQRAFMALCTHIDHQFRLVLGTLREEGLLDDTVVLFTADHGDMLGTHGLWAKRIFYEDSARVPTILLGPAGDARTAPGSVDRRLVQLADVMPTLLDFAGVTPAAPMEGLSMIGDARREVLTAACRDDASATRMATDGRHKLIWYPNGNTIQLFDLREDPQEMRNLAGDPALADVRAKLEAALVAEAWGVDTGWIADGKLVGTPAKTFQGQTNRGLSGQRGFHFPPPPQAGADVVVGTPGG
ncbi:sulfatase-like hydrolase/transferase [Falsiroseomonas sp.]|uniref:sulfatase-like hydrolase/transferase n=1 Tax=Falsiroseomonas sp. TaxID=2870721 RepID=UPI00273466B3|nr:sulfatase-like hydrolase/transferase [Falsiroseomonas sp.]MDP3416472.1 sulfatase-like hydrolase/transferase [Falsiroseomonas sp.]